MTEEKSDGGKLVEVTVNRDGMVSDGKGGFLDKGTKIKVGKETADSLKAKGLA